MLLRPLNLLLLDEPTHHLDIQSKDVLKSALKDYDGTFMIVSHDRDFLHGLTNRLLEVKGGRLRDHRMDITEFIERNKAVSMNETVKQVVPKQAAAPPRTDDRNARKELEKEQRKRKNEVQRCEEQLAKLESEQKDLQERLGSGKLDTERTEEAYTRLGELAGLVEACMRDWERAGSELEALNKELTA